MPNIEVANLGRLAKEASRALGRAATERKNGALIRLADLIETERAGVLTQNRLDVDAARERKAEAYYLDRLTLNPERLSAIARDTRAVAELPDPVGEWFDETTLPNGLRLRKRRVPLGVLGVIYEARPNVTVDIAALAIKSGNACILRGGSDTLATNRALVDIIHRALAEHDLPVAAVGFIDDPDRARILELLRLHEYVELIIPRGGAALHDFCRKNSAITVITGGMGINHMYVDPTADLGKALDVIDNAKTQRPTVCNALGTLLVNAEIAPALLPRLADRLVPKGVMFRADPAALAMLTGAGESVGPAGPGDWDTEWLALVLGVKIVASIDEAIDFISAHSLEHSDGILSRDPLAIAQFLNEVDSSAVFVNASTRFNDGGQFGLGAEVAVSTQRVHARGPMGLRELTSYKWVCEGEGQIRD